MSTNLDNILPLGNDADKKKQLQKLSDELQFLDTIEEDNGLLFEKDAAEGLSKVDKTKASVIINSLNSNLQKQLHKKKTRKIFKEQSPSYLTIITILLLIIISFIVLKKML
ncbi:MAG: hypothetical protein HOO89_05085 [Ferruginibacter sp.]|nr:hypothetical protein [Ferruginibacter sp.]